MQLRCAPYISAVVRYKAIISYNGTRYAGWQRQPNAPSVQQEIEDKLSLVCQAPITIVGCGRTDAGVHAKNYVFHVDLPDTPTCDMKHRLNRMLTRDILVQQFDLASPSFHARFDARKRTYRYYLSGVASPFHFETQTYYPQFHRLDPNLLDEMASLIASHTEFFPFCKTNHDAETVQCQIFQSSWKIENEQAVYEIAANRFLRGMVRLIVGMSLRVAIGEVPLSDVAAALDKQVRLQKSYSAPAEGLFLEKIEYES